MLKEFIKSIIALVGAFGTKPKLSQILTMVLTSLPEMVYKIIVFSKYNTKEKFDEFLETLDAYTGLDAGAVDVIRDIPADKEEEFFDAVKEAIKILGYHQLKVEGYYTPET